jgi:hypothetical protein
MSGDNKPLKITEETFVMAMSQITSSYQMLSLFDWDDLVENRERADGYMHITDPTGYKALINSKNADQNHRAAKAARAFIRSLKAIAEEGK